MADATNGVVGGTAAGAATPTVVSQQTSQPEGQQVVGAEGAQAPEPTVEINGEQVPVSRVENALKVEARFTQERQAMTQRERELEARELSIRSGQGILQTLADPSVQQRIGEVAPELIQALPTQADLTADRLAAENLQFRFQQFADDHPEFTDDELTGIAGEAKNLAMRGDFEGAKDFHTIGLRLYRDTVLERERKAAADKALADAQAAAAANVTSGVVGPGMPAVVPSQNAANMTAAQRMAHGHQIADAKRRSSK